MVKFFFLISVAFKKRLGWLHPLSEAISQTNRGVMSFIAMILIHNTPNPESNGISAPIEQYPWEQAINEKAPKRIKTIIGKSMPMKNPQENDCDPLSELFQNKDFDWEVLGMSILTPKSAPIPSTIIISNKLSRSMIMPSAKNKKLNVLYYKSH